MYFLTLMNFLITIRSVFFFTYSDFIFYFILTPLLIYTVILYFSKMKQNDWEWLYSITLDFLQLNFKKINELVNSHLHLSLKHRTWVWAGKCCQLQVTNYKWTGDIKVSNHSSYKAYIDILSDYIKRWTKNVRYVQCIMHSFSFTASSGIILFEESRIAVTCKIALGLQFPTS